MFLWNWRSLRSVFEPTIVFDLRIHVRYELSKRNKSLVPTRLSDSPVGAVSGQAHNVTLSRSRTEGAAHKAGVVNRPSARSALCSAPAHSRPDGRVAVTIFLNGYRCRIVETCPVVHLIQGRRHPAECAVRWLSRSGGGRPTPGRDRPGSPTTSCLNGRRPEPAAGRVRSTPCGCRAVGGSFGCGPDRTDRARYAAPPRPCGRRFDAPNERVSPFDIAQPT
jgi:hypothetical protein